MTRDPQLTELRSLLRRVVRGLRRRHHSLGVEARLGPRHLAVLALVAGDPGRTVGEIAAGLGLSLPAASRLTRDLEDAALVRRREDSEDRRRTVVDLDAAQARKVHTWIEERDQPLASALHTLSPTERVGFLKGLAALADALMEESAHGSVGPHHHAPHRRRPHRHRPL
ncbi:MAG TPA: MarR family transcriptional regulator [Gaiellaceae bacterium]|nr:MarR family transcriptional regulator [Gaiellaceae bacterium]